METLTTPSPEEQTSQDTRIQDAELAYDVAHDSMVQGRQELLQQAQADAEYFTGRGGNTELAERAVAEARDAVNKAIDEATPLYKEDGKEQ